jgi:hypothetical protein
MSTYLLTCQCGKTIPVEVGQAGGHIACECGAQNEVPTLRKLRHLPIATPDVDANQAAWNTSKGIATAGLILAALFAAYALWNRLTEPTVPRFDPVNRTQAVSQGLEKMSPLDSWNLWVEIYQPLAKSGFAVFEHPQTDAIERYIAQRRVLQTTLLIIAAVCAAIGAAVAFWPKAAPAPKRH